MKKFVVLSIIFAVVGRVIVGAVGIMLIAGTIIFAQQPDLPPDPEKARWGIQTYVSGYPSRIYFSEDLELVGNMPVVTGYYSFDGDKYKFHKGVKEFPRDDYSYVRVVDRSM